MKAGEATVYSLSYGYDQVGNRTFRRLLSSSGTTPNPYRYGAAWGYITDPNGFLQLGARYYWPEVGRFVSQDPRRRGRPISPTLALAREIRRKAKPSPLLPTNGFAKDPLAAIRQVFAARRMGASAYHLPWPPEPSEYPYANSNPVHNTDPDGQCWMAATAIVAIALLLYLMYYDATHPEEGQPHGPHECELPKPPEPVKGPGGRVPLR